MPCGATLAGSEPVFWDIQSLCTLSVINFFTSNRPLLTQSLLKTLNLTTSTWQGSTGSGSNSKDAMRPVHIVSIQKTGLLSIFANTYPVNHPTTFSYVLA